MTQPSEGTLVQVHQHFKKVETRLMEHNVMLQHEDDLIGLGSL